MSRCLALTAPLLLGACAHQPLCQAPLAPVVEWQLFLGGDVAGPAWNAFAKETIEPAFPEGFTVVSGDGFWRGGEEHSRVLIVVTHDTRASSEAITRIAAAYRARYAQQSILILRREICGTF